MDDQHAAVLPYHGYDLDQIASAIWTEIEDLAFFVLRCNQRVLHDVLNVLVGDPVPAS